METVFCEVIGCGKKAEWKLWLQREAMPEEPILEEYICEEHKGELTLLHPDLACLYMPLQSNLETKSG